MTYMDWKHDFEPVAQGDPERYAQLWNLEHETRISKEVGLFKRRIGHLHQHRQHASASPQQNAVVAFDEAIDETKPVNSKWLGCLETTNAPHLPNTVITTIVKYRYKEEYVDPYQPMRDPFKLNRPLKTESRKGASGNWVPARRFIWVTFSTSDQAPLPQDATTVKREMGLDSPEYSPGVFIYRFELTIEPTQRCFSPTCLDAGLRPAWKPPPDGFTQPWGLTRDLTDGRARWPELLVETKDYLHQASPQGELVSPPGQVVPVSPIQIDYIVGR